MSWTLDKGMGLLAGLGSLLSTSCVISDCELNTNASECQAQVQVQVTAGQRFDLSARSPIVLSLPRVVTDAMVTLVELQLIDQIRRADDLAHVTVPQEGQIAVILTPAVASTLRGGPVGFRFRIGGYWDAQSTAKARFFVGPKLGSPVAYAYTMPATTYPVAVEISRQLNDGVASVFVTEYYNSTRQLSRYTLDNRTSLNLDKSFNWVVGASSDALMTLNQNQQDIALEYQAGTGTTAIPLPRGAPLPPDTRVPDSTFISVQALRGVPDSQKLFFYGATGSGSALQTCSFDGTKFACATPVALANLTTMAARSLDAARPVDPTAPVPFDGIAIDGMNQITLLRNGMPTSPADFALGQQASAAFSTALGGTTAAAIALADLDDDGLQDVLIAPQSGGLLWAAQTQDGTFLAAQPLGDSITGVKGLAVGDLDGDNLLDVVIITSNSLVAYRNVARG